MLKNISQFLKYLRIALMEVKITQKKKGIIIVILLKILEITANIITSMSN